MFGTRSISLSALSHPFTTLCSSLCFARRICLTLRDRLASCLFSEAFVRCLFALQRSKSNWRSVLLFGSMCDVFSLE